MKIRTKVRHKAVSVEYYLVPTRRGYSRGFLIKMLIIFAPVENGEPLLLADLPYRSNKWVRTRPL